MSKFHYTYRITNLIENKHYYGVRSSKCHPSEDLGIVYFSSSKDKEFRKDQKENPQNYKYKVVSIHLTRKEAVKKEIKLHEKFDVAKNESFYNLCKQRSTGFDIYQNALVRKKIALAVKKQFSDPIKKERHRKACIGRKHTEEQNKQHSLCMTGANNPAATKINIYDADGKLQYSCHGNFRKTCYENNLPVGAFKRSLRLGGTPIYQQKQAQLMAEKLGTIQYVGWSAKYA